MSDLELIAALKDLARRERVSLKTFLRHLIDFEERGLIKDTPHPTMFVYCVKELRLAESEAYKRIQVARAAKAHPQILDALERGQINLSVATVLAPHFNNSNCDELLQRARGLSKREAEFLAASMAPKPMIRDVVRAVHSIPAASSRSLLPPAALSAQPAVQAAAQDRIEPMTEHSVRIAFTAARKLLEKIERAKALLRHKFPRGRIEDIVEEAITLLLDKRDPSRKSKPARIRKVLRGRRRIAQGIKDRVWKREGGRCAFVAMDGRRCEQASWLEFDHQFPFALGGRSDDAANIRLLCRAHNQMLARLRFGDKPWH